MFVGVGDVGSVGDVEGVGDVDVEVLGVGVASGDADGVGVWLGDEPSESDAVAVCVPVEVPVPVGEHVGVSVEVEGGGGVCDADESTIDVAAGVGVPDTLACAADVVEADGGLPGVIEDGRDGGVCDADKSTTNVPAGVGDTLAAANADGVDDGVSVDDALGRLDGVAEKFPHVAFIRAVTAMTAPVFEFALSERKRMKRELLSVVPFNGDAIKLYETPES